MTPKTLVPEELSQTTPGTPTGLGRKVPEYPLQTGSLRNIFLIVTDTLCAETYTHVPHFRY